MTRALFFGFKRDFEQLAFIGGGETSDSLDEISAFVFKRDYEKLAKFTGKEKLDVIFAPETIIAKSALNLFPEKLKEAQEAAAKAGEHSLAKGLRQAERDYQGEKPEFDLFDALKEGLKDFDG